MDSSLTPILILVAVASLICGAMVTLSWLLGPKKVTPYKASPYECGVEPVGSARERFPIKFYLVAMLFILFDIEVVFLWSWLTVFKNAPPDFQVFSFWAIMVYMALWILGDAYVLRLNAIDWDETTSLEPGKQVRSLTRISREKEGLSTQLDTPSFKELITPVHNSPGRGRN